MKHTFILLLLFIIVGCGHLKPPTEFEYTAPLTYVAEDGTVRPVVYDDGTPAIETIHYYSRKDVSLEADLSKGKVGVNSLASPVIDKAGYWYNQDVQAFGGLGERIAAGATAGAMMAISSGFFKPSGGVQQVDIDELVNLLQQRMKEDSEASE